jgi:hypothetical protein
MCRINKYISFYSFLLAGLVIIAHMLIPHDHHLADPIPGQEESCPASDGKTSHHSGFPVHCHALNYLYSEEDTAFSADVYFQITKVLFINNNSHFNKELQIILSGYYEPQRSVPDHYLSDFVHLRAPPFFS